MTEVRSDVSGVDRGGAAAVHTGRRHALALGTVLLGYLTLPMLMSGTTIALPAISTELGASGAALQWVVVGYLLTASSLMLVAGSLGDLYGRRRLYAAGAVSYAIGSLASSLATDILLLDLARTVSGIGAAAVMSSGGAILGATFTGAARTRAFAALGATAGVGLAVGPTLSGLLVSTLGWRAYFAMFAAVGLVIWAGTAAMTDAAAAPRPKLDIPGSATLVGGLALVMFGVNQAADAGWGSTAVLAPLVLGLALFGLFVLVEHRSPHPVLELTVLRNRRFAAWCLACLVVSAGPSGVLAFLPTFLQGVTSASAQRTGLIMMLLTAPVLLMPQAGAWLINRGTPPRGLVTVSLLLIAAGNAWLTVLQPGINTTTLAGPLLTIGVGMGLMMGTTDAQAMNEIPPQRLGMAMGLLNTIRGGGATLVTTLFGSALVTLLQARLGAIETAHRVAAGDMASPDRASHALLLAEAWHVVTWSIACACTVGAVIVWRLLRPYR